MHSSIDSSIDSIIAIMLGRLQMDIEPCIDAYSKLSSRVFCKRGLPISILGNVKGRYKASELEDAVKEIIRDTGSLEDAPLNDNIDRGCRVYVVEPEEARNKADVP